MSSGRIADEIGYRYDTRKGLKKFLLIPTGTYMRYTVRSILLKTLVVLRRFWHLISDHVQISSTVVRTSEDREVIWFHSYLIHIYACILVLRSGMSTENNMVMDQSDEAACKRQRLAVPNSSDDAKTFLIGVLGQGTVDLSGVPAGATVQSIEDYQSGQPSRDGIDNSWFGKLPYGYLIKVFDVLSKRKSREQVLHSKGIEFYCSADRERSRQESITRPISCNIACSGPINSPRQDNVSLVLGPSGSGKTTYCVKEHGKLARLSSDDGSARITNEFRVYMYATDLGSSSSNHEETLKDILLKTIRSVLSLGPAAIVHKLTMTLYAIIDEAGCDKFFGQVKNLLLLKEAVKDIATNVQLVVSGTGLDFLTNSIGSSGEGVIKIRMLPWGLGNFKELANEDTIWKLVAKHEIYTNMTTNARAAAYLLFWLKKTATWGNDRDNVPFVVRGVAYDYISGNGLKDADGVTRRQVVRAVLRILKESAYDSVSLPDFDNSLAPDVKRKAQSLVDVHVLKVGDKIQLQDDHHYNVSVTPAITIVLAALLGTTAFMQTNWSGFETVVALNELFKLVREADDEQLHEFPILQLDKPYDARKGKTNLEVPEMTSSMVLINGSKASYADVIAPFRLIQCKHSESDTPTTLYIGDELKKMGLLLSSSIPEKVFAAGQYSIWKASHNHVAALQSNESTASVGQPNAERARPRGLYPASTLVSKEGKMKPTCRTYTKLKLEEWHQINDQANGTPPFGYEIDRSTTTTVVFATNASAFKIWANSSRKGMPSQLFDKKEDNFFDSPNVSLSGAVFGELKKQLVKGVVVQLAFASSAAP